MASTALLTLAIDRERSSFFPARSLLWQLPQISFRCCKNLRQAGRYAEISLHIIEAQLIY